MVVTDMINTPRRLQRDFKEYQVERRAKNPFARMIAPYNYRSTSKVTISVIAQ